MTAGPNIPWRVSGTYLESCNCEAICPCRRVGGRAGGRSTYGICFGALSWLVERGYAGQTSLDGLSAAMVYSYDDDEAGSPWQFVFYVDEQASDQAGDALAAILLGRRGGPHVLGLPWVRKPGTLQKVERKRIEISHDGGRHALRVDGVVELSAERPVETGERISCIVPGHETAGTELYADRLTVDDAPFVFELEDSCAFTAPFDYASD